MSLQSAQEFTIAASRDSALGAQIAAAVEGKSAGEAAAAFVAIGKSHGYEFTPEEAAQTRSQVMQAVELSEDDLEKVAGGTGGAGSSAGSLISTFNGGGWMPPDSVGPVNGGIINMNPGGGKTDAGKQIADIFSGW
jgi:predicted ribosomally synthesized peptide with nif11-like leader